MHALPDDALRGQRAAAGPATNHLDLESIAALNNGLEAVKCNVLFASHDHQLVQTVANRVFDFTSDGKLIDRKMTYDEYLESQKAD